MSDTSHLVKNEERHILLQTIFTGGTNSKEGGVLFVLFEEDYYFRGHLT